MGGEMAETINSAYKYPIIDVACGYPGAGDAAGSKRALAMYFTEGHIPTQIQLHKSGGTPSENIYAAIRIECLNNWYGNGGSVLSSTDMVLASNTGGANRTATARLTSFVKEIVIPAGTAVIGVALHAWCDDYDDVQTVYVNVPPRSLTLMKVLR